MRKPSCNDHGSQLVVCLINVWAKNCPIKSTPHLPSENLTYLHDRTQLRVHCDPLGPQLLLKRLQPPQLNFTTLSDTNQPIQSIRSTHLESSTNHDPTSLDGALQVTREFQRFPSFRGKNPRLAHTQRRLGLFLSRACTHVHHRTHTRTPSSVITSFREYSSFSVLIRSFWNIN